MSSVYRTDIDGLRAVAVLSVIFFHLGFLPNGYLGVDVFFVISGYLITGIVYREVSENTFSIFKFYERRIRRIIPLVIFTSFIALILGIIFMLPDDLENLCQSVFASNFSANNILMKITSEDYWAVKNDYKPLMHTWSLGVEEQFYLLYPVLFFFFKGEKKKFIFPILILLTLLSVFLFCFSNNSSAKFYFLQFRFFELSVGGVFAIYFSKKDLLNEFKNSHYLLYLFLTTLTILLLTNFIKNNDVKIITTVILTVGVLVLGGVHFQKNKIYKELLSNKFFVGIGKISFSLYMWHQIVFAFSRYFLIEKIDGNYAIILIAIVVILSVLSYFFIETPFRNNKTIKTKPLFFIIGCCFVIVTLSSLYVYMVGGVIKDVPELGINTSNRPKSLNFFSSKNNINIQYNENVRSFDKPFSDDLKNKKIKVLVLGNSFGRDIVNVLLESFLKDQIQISYSDLVTKSDEDLKNRIHDADLVLFGSDYPDRKMISKYNINLNKVWIFGTKDFGNSNGIHYNKYIEDYTSYRAFMKLGVLEKNQLFKKEWGEKYIDLIDLVDDSFGKVLVFTPEGKFISQDTVHFTKYGAIFYSKLLKTKSEEIFNIKSI